ncbi:MAG: potassium channel family protein [Candidatus Korobacteraceae bacterium]
MSIAEASQRASARLKKASLIAEHKFFVLFVYLLATLVFYPYAENRPGIYMFFRVFGAAGMLFAVYAINLRRTVLVCALLLAVPAVLHHIIEFRADAGALPVFGILLSFGFDLFLVVVLFRRVILEAQPTSETILGALCIYLLVGFSFASVYGMVAALQPKAFYLDPLVNTHSIPRRFDMVYYSFGTLTSVGASGITPVSDAARSLTAIEATIGVLYLAVLIARLISGYRPPSARD